MDRASHTPAQSPVRGAGQRAASPWPLTIGVAAVYLLFELVARRLGSDRGQAGLAVAAVVVAATAIADRVIPGAGPGSSIRRLGLGTPALPGMVRAFAASTLLLLVVPAYFAVTQRGHAMYPGWVSLLPGLFAQAGIAEEVLFRALLFGRLRSGRTFWGATFLATGPFVLVHLWMFATLPWGIALGSVALSAVMSLPLAYLFETGGRTIWGPALLHWIVQSVPKVVTPGDGDLAFALVWIAGCAVLPYVVFVAPAPPAQ